MSTKIAVAALAAGLAGLLAACGGGSHPATRLQLVQPAGATAPATSTTTAASTTTTTAPAPSTTVAATTTTTQTDSGTLAPAVATTTATTAPATTTTTALITVPNVVGTTYSQAQSTITGLGLQAANESCAKNTVAEPNAIVTATAPTAGSTLPHNGVVTLFC